MPWPEVHRGTSRRTSAEFSENRGHHFGDRVGDIGRQTWAVAGVGGVDSEHDQLFGGTLQRSAKH
jgi:hypothetical protein